MATKTELEIRIRELERRLENDEQDMVEVCERIEKLEGDVKKRFMELEDTPEDRATEDVSAKKRCVDEGVGETPKEVSTDVDAIMAELREALRDKMLEYHTDYADHEEWQSDNCPKNIHEYGNATEVEEFSVDITNAIEKIVSPHIERLVGERDVALSMMDNCEDANVELHKAKERVEAERDEYKKSSNDWARHFKLERTARISAEAELEQLVADVKLGRERVIAERDALQERVQKLEQEDAIRAHLQRRGFICQNGECLMQESF